MARRGAGKGFRAKAPRPRKDDGWRSVGEDERFPVLSLQPGRDARFTKAELRRIAAAEEEYEACQRLMRERYDSSPAVKARAAAEKKARLREARARWREANEGVEAQETA